MFDATYNDFILLLLVFMRMSGAVLLNPLFGRRNVPGLVRAGLSLALTVCVYPLIERVDLGKIKPLVFAVLALKEFFVGFAIGFIMQLVFSSVITAGEISDIEIGISMSRLYDPSSNISLALTGTLYNIMLVLVFFASNSHLTLIRLVCNSCRLFPVGKGLIDFSMGKYVAIIFGDILLLSLKLAMPVLAAILLTEAGLGFLMRNIPQMHIFALGLQLKLAVGLFILLSSLPVISRALDKSIAYLFESISRGIEYMLTP